MGVEKGHGLAEGEVGGGAVVFRPVRFGEPVLRARMRDHHAGVCRSKRSPGWLHQSRGDDVSTPNIEIGRTSDQTKATVGIDKIEVSAVEARVHRPRLGFLGIGWIGRNRMECIATSRAASIVMLADQNVDMAKTAAKDLQLTDAHIANSLDELLDAELDGIVIATPAKSSSFVSLVMFQTPSRLTSGRSIPKNITRGWDFQI